MRLYLCYHRADRAYTAEVAEELEKLGHTVWWEGRLVLGEAFEHQFQDQMWRAEAVVAFEFPEWIAEIVAYGRYFAPVHSMEVAFAERAGKPILRVYQVDDADLPAAPQRSVNLGKDRDAVAAAKQISAALHALSPPADIDLVTTKRDLPDLNSAFKLIAKGARENADPGPEKADTPPPRAVFVVHGHDEAMLKDVENFLHNIGITPVVLRRMKGGPDTLFEKFKSVANEAKFAIALLSGDDYGASLSDYKEGAQDALMYRGRQNVILEIGFFFGKLGWDSVYLLYNAPKIQARFEWPSDIAGTTNRQSYDSTGEWREFLKEQLKAKGLL